MEQPERVTHIGIFGGTFDPIHVGHLIIASEMRWALDLERVLFVPAARPPHKTHQEVTSDRHRLAMVQRAIIDNPQFEMNEIELHRAGNSYTADTLEDLAKEYPHKDFYFLMGEDSLRDLPRWHDPERIVRMAKIGVAARPGIDVDFAGVHAAIPGSKGRLQLVETPEIGVSSRDIRDRVCVGKPIRYLVPYHVEEYIVANELYRSCGPDR